MTFRSLTDVWLEEGQGALIRNGGNSDAEEDNVPDRFEDGLPTRPPTPEPFTAPIPLRPTFSLAIIRTPEHYRTERASSMPKFSPPPSSIFKAEALSSRTQETASHGRGPFEMSFSEDEEPGSDDESDPDSYGEYSLEKRNIVPELPSQYLASSSYTDPWPLGSDRWEVSPSSYSPAPTDTSNPAIPLPLGFVPDVPTRNSPYQPPLSPLVDPQSVGDATPWIWASQPLVDHEAFESPDSAITPWTWMARPLADEEASGAREIAPAPSRSDYFERERILHVPEHLKEPMLKGMLQKTVDKGGPLALYYPTPSSGASTSIAGRLEANSTFTSSSKSTSISRYSGTTTTVHSTTNSSVTVAATSYHASPAFSSSSYDADLDSVSATSPRFEDFFSPSLNDGLSPPLLGILRDFENSPGPATSFISPPARPTRSMVAPSSRPSFNSQTTGRHAGPNRPRATEETSLPSSRPNPTEVVTGIVQSISRSTTDLVSAVLNPEDSVPSSGTGMASRANSNGVPSMSRTCVASTSPSSSSDASSPAVVPPGPAIARAGSGVIVSSESHSQTDSSMSLFSNASQFGMRDPAFHVASRDVQVTNIYNITLNQVQATTTKTT